MRAPFFHLRSESDILQLQSRISECYHIYDENMLASRFFWLAQKAVVIWEARADADEKRQIYYGGA